MLIVDLRPTIAITKAHMKLPEMEESVRSGRLVPDGKVCINSQGELAVTKVAVEPVWYLPGVAERFGIDEGTLRRSLFEFTGGMYPEVNRECGVDKLVWFGWKLTSLCTS